MRHNCAFFAAIRDYPIEVGGKEIILYC